MANLPDSIAGRSLWDGGIFCS